MSLHKNAEPRWYEKNFCTFYGNPGAHVDDSKFVLGFTWKIIDCIRSRTLSKQEGGWIGELKHVHHKDKVFRCFLTNSGGQTVRSFQSDIVNTPNMPPLLMQNFDNKTLQSFMIWKSTAFAAHCAATGYPVDKSPVECRNLQIDKLTYCFAPDLFFAKTGGGVTKLEANRSEFVWVDSYLLGMVPLVLNSGKEDYDILETMRGVLTRHGMEEAFLSFLIISGHTSILSLHYSEMLSLFGHVPALIVTGAYHTGESSTVETALSFLGTNALDICVIKDSTISALRDRYSGDHFPIVIHDPEEHEAVTTAIMETYEGRAVIKYDKHWVPGTTLAITCNDQMIVHLQSKYQALTRSVIVPMLKQMTRVF